MDHFEQIKAEGIEAYLKAHEHKELLRFITCGSVDDGKSTLIGRLLYESKLIYEDQLAALEADSARMGTQGGRLDLALLVDGLAAEREQGITIDVAYRYFSTKARKFIVADTPGHEQYTRNMVTGASTADAAIILLDARKGILTQTRRHTYICSLLGIQHLVLAVNKMDLVDYSEEVFLKAQADYRELAASLGNSQVTCIPVSALEGDNVTKPSDKLSWYQGRTLLGELETLKIGELDSKRTFRMPVQWVNRPSSDFRGFSGYISRGSVGIGDKLAVLPAGTTSSVKSILGPDGDLKTAVAGQSVTICLNDEVDASRGDILADAADEPKVADQFRATIVWMHEEPMLPGREYVLKIGAKSTAVSIAEPRHKVNVNTFEELPARTLELNDIGVCNINLDQPIAFDAYKENRQTGGFIIIDRLTNDTVGAGMLDFALWRSENVQWQSLDVNKPARARAKGQKPCVVWFTGLSGSGKSTIANVLETKLHAAGRHTYLLDGDNVRHGLNKDLGFTDADRVENIRRVSEVAKLMTDAGLIVLVSFISPFRSEREMAREALDTQEFIEVYVDTPIAETERRDVKGLYAKARAGEIKNFTGIDSPYEAPLSPDVHVKTMECTVEDAADQIMAELKSRGRLDARGS
ncbi:Bifunctional enzyme CysN/CysC [Planctomycetes bacterium Poly30]|uniref:Multifunctional fusion protein n=1 Tax=Saltatorellus ferox TaxID=2528018 RepID=A0A518F0I0_9BACT|nr:Bifunctional enzyme CysN/CysC [Planctomycetes bacterium Poly30]